MGIRLVYGLKTGDISYLKLFYPSRRLAESAQALGLDYAATIHVPGGSSEATATFCKGHVALLRGELPVSLYEQLEASGTVVVNSARSTAQAGDKLRTAERCSLLGIAHPRTVSVDPNSDTTRFEYPFIAKPRFGKMGRGVFLVESVENWRSFLKTETAISTPYLAQEYIVASHGRDVRFFFARFDERQAGVTPVVVLRRGTGLASNAHAGGAMEPFEPPEFLRAEAERLFMDSGLVYGTVDFLFADETGSAFFVCETNACPGFEALESMSGLDVARAILLAVSGTKGIS
ncbi:MAG: hypothetical protein A2Y38_20990 [Spirochaetes bacterium GWB1_59_5]|nr:MAG: hypothetical protein A2Y38_20990 [Spirochaetes bacterium GWB1_59_5]